MVVSADTRFTDPVELQAQILVLQRSVGVLNALAGRTDDLVDDVRARQLGEVTEPLADAVHSLSREVRQAAALVDVMRAITSTATESEASHD